jgi:cytochrome c-type biogenesis protein
VIEFGPEAFATAFAAGFLSFTSPCVLPLVPGYLSYVSGVAVDELGAQPRRVTLTTAWFVAGFAAMFVALGAGAAWFGTALIEHRRLLEIAGGIFVIFAGLVFLGVRLPIALLREKRIRWPRIDGPLGPSLAGVAFAVGWTPCVGPTLAAILALSAGGASPEQGAVLLAVYALGLGVPFLAFGLAFTRAIAVVGLLRRHWRVIYVASGALLVVFGLLLATGELTEVTSRLARFSGVTL